MCLECGVCVPVRVRVSLRPVPPARHVRKTRLLLENRTASACMAKKAT